MARYRKKGRVKPTWQLLWAAQDGICAYCGEWTHPREASVDHVIPKHKGGADVVENAVMACKECNSLKGDSWPSEDIMTRVMKRNGWMPTHPMAWDAPELCTYLGLDPCAIPAYT